MNELLLQQLKDIHLPQKIQLWPIAPGWIALLFLIICMISTAFYIFYKKTRKKLAIKFALKRLDHLQTLLVNNPDHINIAAEISTLLRRTALYYFKREEIAALTGQKWLDFLNRKAQSFSVDTGQLLTDAPYQKEITHDLKPLVVSARAWLIHLSKNVINVEK